MPQGPPGLSSPQNAEQTWRGLPGLPAHLLRDVFAALSPREQHVSKGRPVAVDAQQAKRQRCLRGPGTPLLDQREKHDKGKSSQDRELGLVIRAEVKGKRQKSLTSTAREVTGPHEEAEGCTVSSLAFPKPPRCGGREHFPFISTGPSRRRGTCLSLP